MRPEQNWSVRMLIVLQDSIRQRESDDTHDNNPEEIRQRFQALMEEGMDAFAVIHSIVDTAKKKKQDPF